MPVKSVRFTSKVGYNKMRKGRSFGTAKSKALTKPEKKQVVKIAKSVVKANLERKHIQVGLPDTPHDNFKIFCINPLASLVAGTGTNQRVGQRIQNVKLRFKMFYTHGGYNNSTRVRLIGDSMLRVLVIRTKRELTTNNSVWADITGVVGKTDTVGGRDDTILYQPDYPYPYNSVIADIRRDNNYEVLYDKTVQSSAGMMNNYDVNGENGLSYENSYLWGNVKPITGTVALPQCEFNETNNYLNNKNTYIVVMPLARPIGHGTSNFVCGWTFGQYSVEYTDA